MSQVTSVGLRKLRTDAVPPAFRVRVEEKNRESVARVEAKNTTREGAGNTNVRREPRPGAHAEHAAARDPLGLSPLHTLNKMRKRMTDQTTALRPTADAPDQLIYQRVTR
jgi:hypothetical protein